MEIDRKVVVIIIDAFRYEFLSRLPETSFIQSAVRLGHAYLYRAKLQSPTVTLPRLKVTNICNYCNRVIMTRIV